MYCRQSVGLGADYVFADFEYDVHVAAGGHRNITLSGVTVMVGEDEVRVRVYADGSIFVDYAPEVTVKFRVLTKRANTAACELRFG